MSDEDPCIHYTLYSIQYTIHHILYIIYYTPYTIHDALYRVVFLNWSPPQNHKFFESQKNSGAEKSRVPRVPKKTPGEAHIKITSFFLVFGLCFFQHHFPLCVELCSFSQWSPTSKSWVPSCSFLHSCKGAITCHFSVGLGRGKQESTPCKLVILR